MDKVHWYMKENEAFLWRFVVINSSARVRIIFDSRSWINPLWRRLRVDLCRWMSTELLDCVKLTFHLDTAPAGPYCNRTWDGWLCWGDSPPGIAIQDCPNYFQDFDPTGAPLSFFAPYVLTKKMEWLSLLDVWKFYAPFLIGSSVSQKK